MPECLAALEASAARFQTVALGSYVIIFVLNLVFGLLCWFLFGDKVLESVLDNLPNDAGGGKGAKAGRFLIVAIKGMYSRVCVDGGVLARVVVLVVPLEYSRPCTS